MESQSSLGNLPNEILLFLFSYLEAPELINVGRVCKLWYALHNDTYLWKRLYHESLSYGLIPAARKDEIFDEDWQRERREALRALEKEERNKAKEGKSEGSETDEYKKTVVRGYYFFQKWRNAEGSQCKLLPFKTEEEQEQLFEDDGAVTAMSLGTNHVVLGVKSPLISSKYFLHIYEVPEKHEKEQVKVKYRARTKDLPSSIEWVQIIDKQFFVAATEKTVSVFDITNGNLVRNIDLEKTIEYIGLARNLRFHLPSDQRQKEKLLFFTVKNMFGRINLATGKVDVAQKEDQIGKRQAPYTCSIYPLNARFYLTGFYGELSSWDAEEMKEVSRVELPKKDWAYYVSASPKYIFAGSDGQQVAVFGWNAETGEIGELATVWDAKKSVVALSYHNHHVVCLCTDNSMLVWHGITLEHIIKVPGQPQVSSCISHPYFPLLLGQSSQKLHIWDMSGSSVSLKSIPITETKQKKKKKKSNEGEKTVPLIANEKRALLVQGESVFLFDFTRLGMATEVVKLLPTDPVDSVINTVTRCLVS